MSYRDKEACVGNSEPQIFIATPAWGLADLSSLHAHHVRTLPTDGCVSAGASGSSKATTPYSTPGGRTKKAVMWKGWKARGPIVRMSPDGGPKESGGLPNRCVIHCIHQAASAGDEQPEGRVRDASNGWKQACDEDETIPMAQVH